MSGKYIVKRNGQIEPYSAAKLAASIKAACMSVRALDGEAETTAELVRKKFEAWLQTKTEVTSADIRRISAEALATYNEDAAYIYKKQRQFA